MKRIVTSLLLTAAAISAHADTLVSNDSTMYYIDDKDFGDIVTVNVKRHVALPSGLTESQKQDILAIVTKNAIVRKEDGHLVSPDFAPYDLSAAKVMTDKAAAKIAGQNRKGRSATYDWTVTEYVAPVSDAEGLAVLCDDVYSYTGGAHGMAVRRFINYSLAENRELTLADFVDLGNPVVKEALQRELTSRFDDKYGAEWGDLREFRDSDLLPVSEDFYLTDKGMVFVYQEYGIGPYAIGQPAIEVPYLTLFLIGAK